METRMEKVEMEKKNGLVDRMKRGAAKACLFAYKHSDLIMAALVICLLVSRGDITAFAEEEVEENLPATSTDAADKMWNEITALVTKWVARLGGAVIFVGGVLFGLGWKSDDAEQKSRGINTIIAGAIVAAMAGLATVFFKIA